MLNLLLYMVLPLCLFAVEKLLQDADNLGERGEVDLEVGRHLGAVVAELGVKVLAVGAGAHGSAEDGLHEEAVVRLEGAGVGGAERVGELLVGLGRVGRQGEAGEFEATDEPEESLGGSVFLGLELIAAEILNVGTLNGGGELAVADFLDVADHVVFDGGKSDGAEGIEYSGQRLGRFEEFAGADSASVGLVNGHVDKGPFESLHNGAAGRDHGSGHDGLLRSSEEIGSR